MFQSELHEPRWKDGQVHLLNEMFLNDSAKELLNWSLEIFSPSLYFECRFNLEDLIILQLFKEIGHYPVIFYLDSGRLPESTYDLIKKYQKLGFTFNVYRPELVLLDAELKDKPNCQSNARMQQKCSFLRIDEPRHRALENAAGWISAQRIVEDELPLKVTIDHIHGGILKINPLSGWRDADIWSFIKSNNIDYNPIHDKEVRSISCSVCSQLDFINSK